MDRLSYMLSLMQSLQSVENDCGVNFLEQRIALKLEIDKEIDGLISSKGARHSYVTQTDDEIPF